MATDEEDFDATEQSLQSLRSTTQGQQVLDEISAAAKTTAQQVWTVAAPVLEAAGQAAGPIIMNFALSALQGELESLAGGKK